MRGIILAAVVLHVGLQRQGLSVVLHSFSMCFLFLLVF